MGELTFRFRAASKGGGIVTGKGVVNEVQVIPRHHIFHTNEFTRIKNHFQFPFPAGSPCQYTRLNIFLSACLNRAALLRAGFLLA